MNSQLLFSSSTFLSLVCFILIIFVKIQSYSISPDQAYKICSVPASCGNFNISYPFWGSSRPSFCGHLGLELRCDEIGGPTITINEVTYHVLYVDESAQTLKISRNDYYKFGICPPANESEFRFLNTTIDSQLLDYSTGYENVTLLYGCSSSPNYIQSFTCPLIGVKYKHGFIQVGANGPGTCNASVIVPVLKIPLEDEMEVARHADLWSPEKALLDGFELRWKLGGMRCEDCTKSNGSCGYDSFSNKTICYCSNHPDNFFHKPCPQSSPSSGSYFNKWRKLTMGIAAGVVGMIIIIFIFLIKGLGRNFILHKVVIFSKRNTENCHSLETFVRNFGSLGPTRYDYSDVKKMTESFSNKLGQGGYGDVYKGKLPDGRLVAVKFLKESKGNGEEFTNEVASISRTSHVNIVNLLGFCYERTKRALIYEFMPNGSLDKFIYDLESSTTKSSLEWKTTYQIAVGIARGLEYLHRGCNTRIVHFDIKPHNILLDEDFCPKISDFGLAKLCKTKESIISMLGARGTIGYIAPEVICRTFGEVSHRSDVYSYGMMILEMVGGRKNIDVRVSHTSEIYFPNWIYKQLEPGNDFELHGAITEEEKELAKKMVLVSLWCIQTIPSDRPSMTRVVEMLEGGLECLQVPPKPSLASQTRSPQHFSPIASSSSAT